MSRRVGSGSPRRGVAALLAVLVAALTCLAPASPAAARGRAAAAAARVDLCSPAQWQNDFRGCAARLKDLPDQACEKAPVPDSPGSGISGWFGSRPASAERGGPQGMYSQYAYAGYDFPNTSSGCIPELLDMQMETKIANIEFMGATMIIGASNALRERAWDPRSMWNWADPMVAGATRAIYEKVFSVFGLLTLCVVGLYLIWRSRQSDMSSALTTAGWALLVMTAVTAIAAWPVRSANLADATLIGSLGVVHEAVGPRPVALPKCDDADPESCKDHRPPAIRASDTVTESMLYKNWLRGLLGSAESTTARKYGLALYDAKALSWDEAAKIRANPSTRETTIAAKNAQWRKVVGQIKTEDPEAYQYLTGAKGMDRIGAGFIALLAALLFAMFDLTASLLVLLGFLLFRWAVIAAPLLGTIGLLRPAGAGVRRLANAVVAAVFNIAIFGTGAAIYLFAVDMIMGTATLPGWLQVALVWLCGVVGWLLLRPYRRITELGGKNPSRVVAGAGSWHRRLFTDGGPNRLTVNQVSVAQTTVRPEARIDSPGVAPTSDGAVEGGPPPRTEPVRSTSDGGRPETGTRPRPARTTPGWSEPGVPDEPATVTVFRPGAGEVEVPASTPRQRAEAR
ncbi:hypothetical protein GCM10010123_29220 [Pilimelia anulata]|uniref:MFS transporter n=1 Tax=Pilimelia anulata TaxID=53371 RepID=A0A8J3FAI4_9ACTN|nr:MFS transporter [Pilimelia anulata]GGJ97366.1 hypothetical protein GCM10010123_29220 [Pilimelia anulata]